MHLCCCYAESGTEIRCVAMILPICDAKPGVTVRYAATRHVRYAATRHVRYAATRQVVAEGRHCDRRCCYAATTLLHGVQYWDGPADLLGREWY
eukprot:208938-Rhodomonas_salina.1